MSKAHWTSFKQHCRSAVQNSEHLTHAIINSAILALLSKKHLKTQKFKLPPYWDKHCKHAIHERNKTRNIMHKCKTVDNSINYSKLKGKATYVYKNSAKHHWRSYCSTWTALHRSQQQHKHAIKINTSEIHPVKSIYSISSVWPAGCGEQQRRAQLANLALRDYRICMMHDTR